MDAMTKLVSGGTLFLLFLATPLACTLSNVSVEPAATQFYTAGFNVQLDNVTSADWGKSINIFILRSTDSIPIQEIKYSDNTQYTIPDNGNVVNGFFYVGPNLLLTNSYIFWVQTCGENMSTTFTVANQYTLIDQLGNFIIWFKDNMFAIIVGLFILAVAFILARSILAR
jgi:hypothetical protein